MACVDPLLACDYGLDENGKHIIRFVGWKHPDWDLKRFREHYGKSLMMLPCGKCVLCAKDYARTWQARIMCEAEYHEKCCFITLTYSKNPPKNPCKDHLREFVKNVRNKFGQGIKFFGCGEKGELNERSHYHIILFGVDFEDNEPLKRTPSGYLCRSSSLDALWTRGFASVGSLSIESAGYVSKYCDKKKITRFDNGEFVIMSRGLGNQYFKDHYKEIFDSDYLYFQGNKFKIPRYFMKLALSSNDFYLRCLADDYSDRKRLKATEFRYNNNKSMQEDLAILDLKNIEENNKKNKEVARDV